MKNEAEGLNVTLNNQFDDADPPIVVFITKLRIRDYMHRQELEMRFGKLHEGKKTKKPDAKCVKSMSI